MYNNKNKNNNNEKKNKTNKIVDVVLVRVVNNTL